MALVNGGEPYSLQRFFISKDIDKTYEISIPGEYLICFIIGEVHIMYKYNIAFQSMQV